MDAIYKMLMDFTLPKIPLGSAIEIFLKGATTLLSPVTRLSSEILQGGIKGVTGFLLLFPPWLLILLFAAGIWKVSRTRNSVFAFAGLLVIWNLGLWKAAMETLTLVIISTVIAVSAGIPLGILAALNRRAYKIITPVLDFMQTMPAFVYLIPAIPFFGLGPVAAVFATVIFSIPPAIRLTALGIREVDPELVEASDSFGDTTSQRLFKLQIPLAVPTIMAGINQTIMLSLSMVVIASMIGAGGLGGEVWRAIQRLRPGMGFEAGLGVVILAMILDRLSQDIMKKKKTA